VQVTGETRLGFSAPPSAHCGFTATRWVFDRFRRDSAQGAESWPSSPVTGVVPATAAGDGPTLKWVFKDRDSPEVAIELKRQWDENA
jgi:hypothetical protein